MTRHYSTTAFFRQVPNTLLQRYFGARGLFADLDFASMKETKPDELLASWLDLPEEQRAAIEAEFLEIFELSSEKGTRAILDEAFWHLREEAAEQNDFAAMEEVLSRRVRRSQDGDLPWPDLIVIDGGKGQLNGVLRALENLGAHQLEVVGLAKSRRRSAGDDNDAPQHTDERVFLPGVKDPVPLRVNTAERHVMERVRDEAHRFALAFHKKLRRKRTLSSSLLRIPGVGDARARALLQHFGSVGRLKAATVDEIEQVEGISVGLARKIWDAVSDS